MILALLMYRIIVQDMDTIQYMDLHFIPGDITQAGGSKVAVFNCAEGREAHVLFCTK